MKHKKYSQKYYQKNKEKIKHNVKIYRIKNIEKVKETKRKYFQKNKKNIRQKTSAYRKLYPEKRKVLNKKHYEKYKEKRMEWQRNYRRAHPEKQKKYTKRYYAKAQERRILNRKLYPEKEKEWRRKNSDKNKIYQKEYRKINGINKEYHKRYRRKNSIELNRKSKQRRDAIPLLRLAINLRSRIYVAFKGKEYKKSSTTENLIGCSFGMAKEHIEKQFTEGMDWINYGTWHIDHITPLASAKTECELIALFHYTNLSPLWKSDNLRKGSKIDGNNHYYKNRDLVSTNTQ